MRLLIATAAAVLLCSLQTAGAADGAAAVRAALQKLDPTVKVEQTAASPASGLYRATLDGASGYVTADGRYFIFGDMFDVKNRRNLSEDLRRQERLQSLQQIEAGSAITFAPAQPRHTITVFTDVDCPYCRKLHSEIARYNELGIAVRYLAFPRSGPGSESWRTMEAVWCAKDRRDALTRAKRGEKLAATTACAAKDDIARHYALGEKLGLGGTPLIVLEDGAVIGGYVPAAALAAQLEAGASTSASVGH